MHVLAPREDVAAFANRPHIFFVENFHNIQSLLALYKPDRGDIVVATFNDYNRSFFEKFQIQWRVLFVPSLHCFSLRNDLVLTPDVVAFAPHLGDLIRQLTPVVATWPSDAVALWWNPQGTMQFFAFFGLRLNIEDFSAFLIISNEISVLPLPINNIWICRVNTCLIAVATYNEIPVFVCYTTGICCSRRPTP